MGSHFVYNTFKMDTWYGFQEVAGFYLKMFGDKEQHGKITDIHGVDHDLPSYLEQFSQAFAEAKNYADQAGWDGLGRWKFSTIPGTKDNPTMWIFIVQNDVGKETYVYSPFELPWLKEYKVVQKKEKKNGNTDKSAEDTPTSSGAGTRP